MFTLVVGVMFTNLAKNWVNQSLGFTEIETTKNKFHINPEHLLGCASPKTHMGAMMFQCKSDYKQGFNGHDSGTDLLEVPTIYKAHIQRPKFQGISPQFIWPEIWY